MHAVEPTSNASMSTIFPPLEASPCYFNDSLATRSGRIIIYSVIILVSLTANSLVLAIVRRDKNMRKPINYFIMNLCCSDIFIAAVYMPRVLVTFVIGFEWQLEGPLGIISCKIVASVYETAVTVSILTVVVISFERYLLLVFPLKSIIDLRSSKFIIIAIWVVAIAFRWPIAYGIRLYIEKEKLFCHLKLNEVFGEGAQKLYYNIILITLYAIPLGLIIIFYSIIIITLRRRKSVGQGLRQEDNREKKRNLRVLKMVMVVVAVFVVCWLLYFIRYIILSYGVQVPRPCDLLFASFLLAHSNSAITPCLYFVFNENFRRGLQNLVGTFLPEWCMGRRLRNMNGSDTTSFRSRGVSELSQTMDTDAPKKNPVQLVSLQPKPN